MIVIVLGLLCLVACCGMIGVYWQATNAQKSYKDNEKIILEKNRELELDNIRLSTLLQSQNKAYQEKIETLNNLHNKIEQNLQNISNQVFMDNQKHFIEMAENTFQNFQKISSSDLGEKEKNIKNLVDPLKQAMDAVYEYMKSIERERLSTTSRIGAQLSEMHESQKSLIQETAHLARAFRKPSARGQWGEIQLKRIVELAGMIPYCDFFEQAISDGRSRPDMVIKLPGDKTIVVDSKVPMTAYLDMIDTDDETKIKEKLKEHAKQVRTHVKLLSQKKYWEHFNLCPEFVVLFLPNESFFSQAVIVDPGLIDYAITEKVIMATPTTLIAMLKTIYFVWQNEKLSENAEIICKLGRDLYITISDISNHFAKMGKSLDNVVQNYNTTLSVMDKELYGSIKILKEMSPKVLQTYEVKNLPQVSLR